MNDETKNETNFGYKKVNPNEKPDLVKGVFDSVSNKYDLMNDLMSVGIHRLWKKATIQMSNLKKGDDVLDVAGGTGDLAILFSDLVGEEGSVYLSDINESMLEIGRDKTIDSGNTNISSLVADAETLPFPDDSFNCISIAFGIRNVTNKDKALKDFYRCLKPGGRLLVLEFSKPESALLSDLYDLYSFNVLPHLGQWIAGDAESYQYLIESIRKFPSQEKLTNLVTEVGFRQVKYRNLTQGVVAMHSGWKI
jgi:demethylmenaquinone methyltransferase/2-methoxy-6-polyprenyl-1,4-benzoquinol methylase